MIQVNIKTSSKKKCAFCKHWYDVTNSAINPKAPQIGVWEYDPNVKKKCLIRGTEMKGGNFCGKFEFKL